MYFAYAWPKVLASGMQQRGDEPVVALELDAGLGCLAVVMASSIEIWSTGQHRRLIGRHTRDPEAVAEDGAYLAARWRGDGFARLAVVAAGGRARLFDVVWPNASTPRDADADPAALPDRCELILRATLTVGPGSIVGMIPTAADDLLDGGHRRMGSLPPMLSPVNEESAAPLNDGVCLSVAGDGDVLLRHLHRPHRAVLVRGRRRRRIEPRRRESRGSMRRRRRPSARRGDPPGLLHRDASRRGGDVIGSVRASQDRRRRRDPTRDGDCRRRRRRRRRRRFWFRGCRRGAASFGAMARRRRRDVRFVFAAVAEDRRGGRLDRRGATVSRGRRGGLRRPRRDPVEGVEPGGLGVRAGGHGGMRRRRWTSNGGAVAAGWWRRGVAAWSANGCRLMCTLPQGGGTAGSHADADAAPGTPGTGWTTRWGVGTARRGVRVRRRRRFEPETLRGRQADERARPRGGRRRDRAPGVERRRVPTLHGVRVGRRRGGEEEEEEEEGTARRGARRRVGCASFYSRRLAPGITSTRPRGAAPARTCSGRRTGS